MPLPAGGVALFIGQNRVRRYLEFQVGTPFDEKRVEPEKIDEVRKAFASAFGLKTVVVSDRDLLQPELANKELFHLDMLVAVFRGSRGVVAFVPTYRGAPVDAMTHVELPPEMVSRLEAEYDRVAAQMAANGYRVVRLPYADHPVRSPVNVGKFRDPVSKREFVMLGRYPYHLDLPDRRNPQRELRLEFQQLDRAVARWRSARTDENWKRVEETVRGVWQELDRSVSSPNPIFEEQRRIYESNGVEVWPIPVYPTGEGGIHCLVLE